MTAVLGAEAASHHSFTPGVEGALLSAVGAPGGPAARTAGPPLPPADETDRSRKNFADMRYANARPAGYALAHVHVARMGADGRVRIDGDPDPAAPLRERCPVLSCLLPLTDYPGHLCMQPDGTEVWREWPAQAPAVPGRRSQC